MFVIARRSAWPQLRLVPGAVARYHADHVTLLPLATGLETGLSAQPLPGGSYGIILTAGGNPPLTTVVAQYPTRRLARRQLRRLAGDDGWGWTGWLGRGLVAAALLFVIWFLFFLPGDLAALEQRSGRPPGGRDAAAAVDDPVASARAAGQAAAAPPFSTAPAGPALIDDPAARRAPASELPPEPNAVDALLEPRAPPGH